jgi:hypothetical protein
LALPVAEPQKSSKPKRESNLKLKLVWLAIPIGAVVGAGLGLGLYYGLRSR